MGKKDKIEIPGITRKDGELAIEFVDFLQYNEDSPSTNLYLNAANWCAFKKYPTQKVDRFFNLVHMYVHKILRHRKHLLGE